MEAEGPESDPKETLYSTRRACDQCRLRKIRCDKRLPCSNCRSSKIVCRSTGAGQKPSEPKRRVLVSSQYEHKIDLIEDRLASIEDILRDLKSSISSPSNKPTGLGISPAVEPAYRSTPPSKQQITPNPSGYASSTAAVDQHETSPSFEGNSSMAAHSAYASEFLETAVSQSALQMSSPKIGAALSTLKQIVNMQEHQAHPSSSRGLQLPNQMAIRRVRFQDLVMPPMHIILSLCRWVKESPLTVFLGYFPFISVDRFIEKCREVYFAIEDYSDATFIVVNAGLYNVFIEWSFTSKDLAEREEYREYLNLCRNNLETALGNLDLLMPAKPESIEALALGAIHAIEISKPSFAWALTSTAARLCQTLGYHRASSMKHDPPSVQQHKTGLFWSIYCIDKALSLRLGRSSSIQDYDISVSMAFDPTHVLEPWKTIYPLWMRLAKIQGKVYELLYSPAALMQPESDRVAHARQLADEMQLAVMDPFKYILSGNQNLTAIEKFFILSDNVSRLSVLALIYRAIPPPSGSSSTFIPDCIETARAALEAHQNCMNMLTESNEVLKCSYMHWTILYAPFIPFIVIICHVLEEVPLSTGSKITGNTNSADLIRLTDFVLSLHPLTPHSEAIANLHRLCHVLCSVARLYVDAKAMTKSKTNPGGKGVDTDNIAGAAAATDSGNVTGSGEIPASVGIEFDSYLSALGLAPPAALSSMGDSGAGGSSGWNMPSLGSESDMNPETTAQTGMSPATQLGNWFSGNQYMMGLLEEDLSLIDFSAWS